MNSAIRSVLVPWKYDGKLSLAENYGKIIVFKFSFRSRDQESDPVPIERHGVEYSHSHAADYLKIGWRTNASHA